MKFDINVWHGYREKAQEVGKELDVFRDAEGEITLSRSELESYIKKITLVLKECSEYMNQCKVPMKDPIWKYNEKAQSTHPSNERFAHADKMPLHIIRNYGPGFMSSPFKECREG